VLNTHKDGGHLIAVKTQLERVTEKKGCHDHSHRQSDRHLAPLEDMSNADLKFVATVATGGRVKFLSAV